MPAADFYGAVKMNRFILSLDSGTRRRPPEVSSTAFRAQPPDLPPAPLMDMGFASIGPLARRRRPYHPVLVHRLAPLLHASFRLRLAATPLRFAITSPPSGCEKDFHLQAVEHARHTNDKPSPSGWAFCCCLFRPDPDDRHHPAGLAELGAVREEASGIACGATVDDVDVLRRQSRIFQLMPVRCNEV